MFSLRAPALLSLLLVSSIGFAQQQPSRWRIATREVPPFAMKEMDAQGQAEWSGISIELLRRMVDYLESQGEGPFELDFRDMSLAQMLSAVEKSEVDIAAAALTVSLDRERRMDFTHPFHSSGLGIAVTSKSSNSLHGALSAVFSMSMLEVMGGLLALLVLIGAIMYLLERRKNPDQFGGSVAEGIGSGVWWAAVTSTTVGYGDKAPASFAGRLLGFLWMFAGLFIIASFTATVTAAMTVGSLESKVSGPEDLPRIRVGTVDKSTSATYLRSRAIAAKAYDDVGRALQALADDELDAVVYDAPVIRYIVHRDHSNTLRILPGTFQRQDYAFALPSNSPAREQINRALLHCISNAEWNQLLSEYFGRGSD